MTAPERVLLPSSSKRRPESPLRNWGRTVAATADGAPPGVFRCVPELTCAIKEYIAAHDKNPNLFVWTAKAHDILAKVIRANRRLSSKQNEALH